MLLATGADLFDPARLETKFHCSNIILALNYLRIVLSYQKFLEFKPTILKIVLMRVKLVLDFAILNYNDVKEHLLFCFYTESSKF